MEHTSLAVIKGIYLKNCQLHQRYWRSQFWWQNWACLHRKTNFPNVKFLCKMISYTTSEANVNVCNVICRFEHGYLILLLSVIPYVVYRCLECSGPSLYILCAQRGAVNCSRTCPELSGLLPLRAAPAASFFFFFVKKKDRLKQNIWDTFLN